VLPEHNTEVEGESATVGRGFTVTVNCDEAVQPFAAVPTTVYVVVVAGVTLIEVPPKLPGFQT
jgi:hypothetical protein